MGPGKYIRTKECRERSSKSRKDFHANGGEPWNKNKKVVPRETRVCACGCKGTFECSINSKQKYIQGHGRKKLPRETRICAAPGCSVTFEVIITSKRSYCCGGHSMKGTTHTEETKTKMKASAHRGEDNPSKRLEVRKKISEKLKGKLSSLKGKTLEEICGVEGAAKRRVNMEGDNNPAKRPEVRVKISASKIDYHQKHPGIIEGENNPNWHGGTSKLPYPFEFNENLVNYIRERDNNTCQLCGKLQEEEYRKLSVHHINHDKDDLFELNLITLCSSCNSKVNFNIDLWEDYFTFKLAVCQ